MILENKVAIVTGGSMGIGKAIAYAYAAQGGCITICSRDRNVLYKTCQEISESTNAQVEAIRANVADASDVNKLINFTIDRFGTIDILVNCAGIYGPIGLVNNVDLNKWIETVNINLIGTLLCIRGVLPIMMKSRRGKIINLSGGGATAPLPRFSAYSASKAAVVRLTETLAHEMADYNIQINAIAPGSVNTRLLDEVLAAGEAAGIDFLNRSLRQKEQGGVPPEKAAELAVFLASDASNGLSGRLISAVWDNWRAIPKYIEEIADSDSYTLRRVVPTNKDLNI